MDPDDHRDGPAIRKQVEYYFSDENLRTDVHLLKCCGGRENHPVSISRICGFKKMRGYKPKRDVVAALRKSPFLVVSDDGKMVSRKVPLEGPCALDPDYEDNEIAYDPRFKKPAVYPVPLLPQTKPEYPSGVSKNLLKPTGFENTYAEAPLTPAEAEEEESMYHPDKTFIERIELAIQRFKQKRRMHEMYAIVFNKWMRFGGVDSGPRMFGAVSQHDMDGMNAEQIARAKASHNVPWDREDETKWTVDFIGVAKAFLSSCFPAHFGLSADKVENACKVLRSFYNYLLYHNVCPEYCEDIKAARALCDIAETELLKVDKVRLALPGEFYHAASTIFGGSKSGTYLGNKNWAIEARKDGIDVRDPGMMEEEARVVLMSGIAIMGNEEQQDLIDQVTVNGGTAKILADETVGLEVTSITPPTAQTQKLYGQQNDAYTPKIQLEPLGELHCRAWQNPDYKIEYDLPVNKYPDGRPTKVDEGKVYKFWVEDTILKECFVGMKIDARVLTLEGNMTVLDDIKDVMPSFYTWLPNELEMSRQGHKGVVIRDRGVDHAYKSKEEDNNTQENLADEQSDEEE